MRTPVRSETIKFATTRTGYGLTAGAVFVVALSTFSTLSSAGGPSASLLDAQYYVLASISTGLFALMLGVRVVTDDFRYRTIVPTVLAAPARTGVLVAKAVVAAVAAALQTAAALSVMTATALLMTSGGDGGPTISGDEVPGLAGLVGAGALWAVIGVGLGAVVRHQVAAVVTGIIWILLVENLGAGLLGDVGRYLPGQAAHGLGSVGAAGDLLDAPTGGLVLLAYTAAALALAAVALRRRDIA
jgi:ABC-type transport system involved in multi-copper enzyme maturation permease subunit